MKKQLYIAEKPSVAQEFAKALKLKTRRADGYLESDEAVITWCVGHLVTMSYPEEYDPALKKWSLQTLPFIPSEFKYEVIPSVAKQFQIVSSLLNREDVDTIYVCTDSGREGEYIYRLVEQKAQVSGKKRLRVWIDSQTEEEILRGIREAKDLSEYDNLSASAYLRAKEDYLMGINFSRLLTLKYGNSISNYLNTKYSVISVGRVMTCVLGMVVRREREIREFVKTPFYRVISTIDASGHSFEGEWRAVKGSRYFESFDLYKENGFKTEEKAKEQVKVWSDSGYFYSVCLKGSSEVIGYLCFCGEQLREMGYSFKKKYQGQGYAQEAAQEMIAQMKQMGVKRIIAELALENLPSRKLIERLGFTQIGTKKHLFRKETGVEQVCGIFEKKL